MKTKWFVPGDLNGFFGLMFDNITVLSFLAATLTLGFHYPADIVYGRMFPGTALGVLFGNLCYVWLAARLNRKNGNHEATAMPLGIDTPSTIGIALTVLGPCFLLLKQEGLNERDAALLTWQVGMACMVLVGIAKVILSFVGGWIRAIVPQAGLLGSLAGIGLALLGFLPIVDIFRLPLVGLVSLGIVLYTLVGRGKLFGNCPGVLAAVVAGTLLYYGLAGCGGLGLDFTRPALQLHLGWPAPSLGFAHGFHLALRYLPIALPFGMLTVIGGINVTESARVAGDEYRTRDILLVEALATLLAGVCGGVAQTTPYIGHPAYKAMGSRIGYAWLTGLFIGLGGILGYVSFIVELIPRAVLAPILVFVALEIISQAFIICPPKYAPAVAFSFFPAIARLVQIKFANPAWVAPATWSALMVERGQELPEMQVLVALGNGFILTAMLWGGCLAWLIDRQWRRAALYLLILGGLAFFGIIHSALPDGNLCRPWDLPLPARLIPYHFAAAYAVWAAMLFLFSLLRSAAPPGEISRG